MSIKYKNEDGTIIDIPAGSGGSDVWEGTTAELEEAQSTIKEGTVVLVNDDAIPSEKTAAAAIIYDNMISGIEASNVQDAIDGISQNLIALEDRFYTLKTTSPSTVNSWVKLCDLPSGFTHDNCMILNAYILNNTSEQIHLSRTVFELHIEPDDTIIIYTQYPNKQVTIVLYKM